MVDIPSGTCRTVLKVGSSLTKQLLHKWKGVTISSFSVVSSQSTQLSEEWGIIESSESLEHLAF